MGLFAGVRRVLVAHAHPDDESLAGGARVAALAASGVDVVLLTATRGERGEVVPGPLSALAGTDELAAERERELARACRALGIARHHLLGRAPARAAVTPRTYEDSGMRWVTPELAGPAADIGPAAFTAAELAEASADVQSLLDHERPDLVLTYDADGGYGHPDHVHLHHVVVDACRRRGVSLALITSDENASGAERHDDTDHLDALFAALECHRSQLIVERPYVIHSGGQRELIDARSLIRPAL